MNNKYLHLFYDYGSLRTFIVYNRDHSVYIYLRAINGWTNKSARIDTIPVGFFEKSESTFQYAFSNNNENFFIDPQCIQVRHKSVWSITCRIPGHEKFKDISIKI